jgi:AraC-like DNA-binding protein
MADDPRRFDRMHVRIVMGADMVITDAWNRHRGAVFPYWTCYINARNGASLRLVDGRLYPVAPGRAHLIPAWVRWDCVATADTPHLYALFDLVGIPGSLVRERFPAPRSVPLDRHLARCADRSRAAFARGDLTRPETLFAMKSLVYGVLADFFGGLEAEDARRMLAALSPVNPVAPALELIASRLDQPVANRALARACALSEHHFIRTFRKHLGQTPAQYALERRIAAAAEQLALEESPIEDIARRWGFPDRYYFTRMFTRRMGISPAAYRRLKLTP